MLFEEGEGALRMDSCTDLFYVIKSVIAIKELDFPSLSSKTYLCICGMREESDVGSMMQLKSTLGNTRCQRILVSD